MLSGQNSRRAPRKIQQDRLVLWKLSVNLLNCKINVYSQKKFASTGPHIHQYWRTIDFENDEHLEDFIDRCLQPSPKCYIIKTDLVKQIKIEFKNLEESIRTIQIK